MRESKGPETRQQKKCEWQSSEQPEATGQGLGGSQTGAGPLSLRIMLPVR